MSLTIDFKSLPAQFKTIVEWLLSWIGLAPLNAFDIGLCCFWSLIYVFISLGLANEPHAQPSGFFYLAMLLGLLYMARFFGSHHPQGTYQIGDPEIHFIFEWRYIIGVIICVSIGSIVI